MDRAEAPGLLSEEQARRVWRSPGTLSDHLESAPAHRGSSGASGEQRTGARLCFLKWAIRRNTLSVRLGRNTSLPGFLLGSVRLCRSYTCL